MTDETTRPFIDRRSPERNLCVTRAYLREHLGGRKSEVLRAHYVGESHSEPKRFWFDDCPEVREELGMGELEGDR